MKIKEEYILQNIADQWVVIDTNTKSVNFNKILSLNESGCFLWKELEQGSDEEKMITALMNKFGIDEDLAKNDVKKFITELEKIGCLEDYENDAK